jgi:sugar phosphate isomerase/epimerase
MQIFLSTTFHGNTSTDIEEVLQLIEDIDIDGIELGSTHSYRSGIKNIINRGFDKRVVTHNFFPPAKNSDFVINIASDEDHIRTKSINHANYCIEFASSIGAETYTIHPGFLAKPDVLKNSNNTYDFNFTNERISKKDAFANMLESLKVLLKTSKENKIKLAIESEGSLTEPGVLLMETVEEYEQLFNIFKEDIYLNVNLAHTRFASIQHKYKVEDFIKLYSEKIILAEISHNNGKIDQHLPLTDNSFIFDYLPLLPNVPYILELRNSTIPQIKQSIQLMRKYSKKDV